MNGFALFTDGSVHPQRKVGVGGYLLVDVPFLEMAAQRIEQREVSSRLKMKMFEETSSTKLEVQTVLWALESSWEELNGSAAGDLRIYTDSQCVAELLRRRAGLESGDFIARRSGRPLAHAPLYRAFYAAYDQLGFQVVKIAGHCRACSHDTIQRIFSYVDKEVRKGLAGTAERR